MEFCVVLAHYPKEVAGGAEFQSYLIARELVQRGHEAHYVAYGSGPKDIREEEGITVHYLDSQYNPPHVPEEVLDRISEIGPDYAYFRNFADLYILEQSNEVFEGDTIFNISHNKQCIPLRNDLKRALSLSFLSKLVGNPRSLFQRKLLREADQLFAQTEHQQHLLEKNYNLDSSYVGSGHPVPEDNFEKLDPPVVLWLASLKKWKQPGKFVSIAEKCRDLDCRFWIVGRSVNPQFTEELLAEVDKHPNVVYKGGCDIKESNGFIADASLFVNTSKDEGFPNTFMQSWLRRTPVMSLNVDPDSVIQSQKIGVYGDGRLEPLIQGIRELITDDERRGQYGANARAYAELNHDISVVADRIIQHI